MRSVEVRRRRSQISAAIDGEAIAGMSINSRRRREKEFATDTPTRTENHPQILLTSRIYYPSAARRLDQVQDGCTVADRIDDQLSIEGCELTLVFPCQPHKIAVRDLTVGEQAFVIEAFVVHEADVVGPELVPRQSAKSSEDGRGRGGRAGGVRITRVSDYTYQSILGNGAGRPRGVRAPPEPLMGSVMLDVDRIHQRDEHVDVQQVCGHGTSSRS